MTDPTPTDEELAAIGARVARWLAHPRANGMVPESFMFDTTRLIAALRAKSAEVEELKSRMADCSGSCRG